MPVVRNNIKMFIDMWDDPPENAVLSTNDIHAYSNVDTPTRFKSFIDNLEKDLFIKIEEDTENGETRMDITPYAHSAVITPIYFKMILSDEEKKYIDAHNAIVKKMISKQKAKKVTTNRYKIGDILVLRGKIKDGCNRLEKIFEVKKVIWSIRSNPVNVLILKQLSGTNNNRSLTKNDCKKYHIKYEPGLQVYSMLTGFNKRKKIA